MSEGYSQELEVIGATGLRGAGALGLWWIAGPSLQAVGRAFGDWTDYRMRNLLRIGEKLNARREQLGEDVAAEQELVHPRVLHQVIEQGSWADDDVAQEYLAGLLISSRSTGGRDDAGAYYVRLVSGMTTMQIRLHALIYGALEDTVSESGDDAKVLSADQGHVVCVNADPRDALSAMGLADSPEGGQALLFATLGLDREGLSDSHHVSINTSDAAAKTTDVLWVTPTSLGAHLYMWARALPQGSSDALRWREVVLPPFSDPVPTLRASWLGMQARGPDDNAPPREGGVGRRLTGTH